VKFKNCLALYFILTQILIFGQVNTFKKGTKVGLKFNTKTLLKARFDSISICESNIYLAYRKKHFIYYNSKMDILFKGNENKKCYPFKNDFALAFDDKKGIWKAFNVNGETIFTCHYKDDVPTIKKHAVIFENNKTLYLIKSNLSVKYDSLRFFGDKLAYCETSKLLKGEKKVLGYKIKKATYDFDKYLLNTISGHKFHDISTIKNIGENVYYITNYSKPSIFIDSEGNSILDNIKKYSAINNNNLIVEQNNGIVLFNIKKKTSILKLGLINHVDTLSGKYWFNNNDSTFVFDGEKILNTFQGKRISSEISGMVVCKEKNKEFIANVYGQRITVNFDKVLTIFDEKTAVIQNNNQFAYIDIKANKLKTNYFDIYYAMQYSGGGNSRGRKFLGAFVAIIATPLLPLVMAKHKGNSGSIKSHFAICNNPQPFIGGFSIVGTGIKKDILKHADSLIVSTFDNSLHYFFIDETGKQVSKLFTEAYPFYKEWTWVRNLNGKFQKIDKHFKPLDKNIYDNVEVVWNGEYYIVKIEPFKVGLMDKDGVWVAKPIFDWFTIEQNKIKAMNDGKEKIIISK
jgi:hypothetical protein